MVEMEECWYGRSVTMTTDRLRAGGGAQKLSGRGVEVRPDGPVAASWIGVHGHCGAMGPL